MEEPLAVHKATVAQSRTTQTSCYEHEVLSISARIVKMLDGHERKQVLLRTKKYE